MVLVHLRWADPQKISLVQKPSPINTRPTKFPLRVGWGGTVWREKRDSLRNLEQRGELGRVNQAGELAGVLVEAGRFTRCTDQRQQQRNAERFHAWQSCHSHQRGKLN